MKHSFFDHWLGASKSEHLNALRDETLRTPLRDSDIVAIAGSKGAMRHQARAEAIRISGGIVTVDSKWCLLGEETLERLAFTWRGPPYPADIGCDDP